MTKFLSLLSFLLFLTLTGTTCKNSPTEPEKPSEPDTTSHNFIWKLDTLGAEGSVVNDVAIISENDIWAVGQFYKSPYGTNDKQAFNAMHWDGSKWEIKSITINNFGGTLGVTPLTCIRAFSSNDIWVFSDAGSYGKYNGITWQSAWVAERQGGITRIWGESSNKLYFGGTNGSLTYWNGSVFTKLNTGTTKSMIDMWGCEDSLLVSFKDELKSLNRETVNSYTNSGLSGSIISVWYDCKSDSMYSICDAGLMKKSQKDTGWKLVNIVNSIKARRIRGSSSKDVYFVGSGSVFSHYNGRSWKDMSIEIPKPVNGTLSFTWLSVVEDCGAAISLSSGRSHILRFRHL